MYAYHLMTMGLLFLILSVPHLRKVDRAIHKKYRNKPWTGQCQKEFGFHLAGISVCFFILSALCHFFHFSQNTISLLFWLLAFSALIDGLLLNLKYNRILKQDSNNEH